MTRQKRHFYNTGLPFTQPLDANLDNIRRRVFELNKAAMILLDGGVGEGKTTLGVHLAEYIQGKPIIFEEQLAMGGEDFQRKLSLCFHKKHMVLLYDEAGDFNRRGALTKFNAELNRVFETYRAFKIIVILMLPSFSDLDSQLMKKEIARFLIRVYNRGKYQGNFKAYSLYRMYWVKFYMDKLTVKPQAYSRVDPNIFGHFLDLTPARSKELDAYSTAGKLEVLSMNIAKKDGLVSSRDIAAAVERSNIWVRLLLQKLKIKHEKIFKNAKLYKPEVIDIIRAQKKVK